MTNNDELALKPGTYAILFRDNWDGQGDVYKTLATLSDDLVWYHHENGRSLIEYEGDEVLKVWPLDDGSNVLALLAERDADKKRIDMLSTERAKGCETLQSELIQARIRADAAEKRIAELEREKETMTAAALAMRDDMRDARSLLEARTLSVKLPESVIDAICLTAAEIHNLGRGVSDERAQEIINSIRCAAGIKLEVGE